MNCADGRQIRVLVVENHEEVRDLIGNLVAAQGWEPVKAAGIQEAVHYLGRERIDAIILDWELDDGIGSSVLEFAKRQRTSQIPAVIVSSYASVELREQAKRAGALDMLEKPFRIERLTELLCQKLEHTAPAVDI